MAMLSPAAMGAAAGAGGAAAAGSANFLFASIA
jgi:hypothetical protein